MGILALVQKYRKVALFVLKVAIAGLAAGLSAYVAGGGTQGVAAAGLVLAALRELDKVLLEA